MKITVDQIMSFRPCDDWTRERVEALFAGREAVAVLEITDCEEVSAEDRLWLLLHEPILTARQLRHLGCDFAERAMQREREVGRDPDPRSWAAVEVARRYADGSATDEELAAAMDAAWAAARDAAMGAAWAAAMDAARDAAMDAAWAAARDAAMGAAWAAAWAAAMGAAWAAARDAAMGAAWATERAWQLSRVREVLAAEAAKEER